MNYSEAQEYLKENTDVMFFYYKEQPVKTEILKTNSGYELETDINFPFVVFKKTVTTDFYNACKLIINNSDKDKYGLETYIFNKVEKQYLIDKIKEF